MPFESSKERLIRDISDLQERLESLLTIYRELQEATVEEEDRLNIAINTEIKSMDRDITDLDARGKEFSKKLQTKIGSAIVLFEDFSHAITDTPNDVETLFHELYLLLNDMLFELKS